MPSKSIWRRGAVIVLIFFGLVESGDSAPPPAVATIVLSQLAPESMTLLGNASFGRTGVQLELSDPLSKSFDDDDPAPKASGSSSTGKALYNTPFQMLNPSSSFESSFAFAMTGESHGLGFVIVPNNQDIDAAPSRHGFSVQINASNNTITIWSGGLSIAAADVSFSIARGTRGFVWILYDCISSIVEVSASNLSIKPPSPAIRQRGLDLSSVFNEFMYVGFAASSTPSLAARNTIYSWNFTRWTAGPSGHPDPAPLSIPAGPQKRGTGSLAVAAIAVGALLAFVVAGGLLFRHLKQQKQKNFGEFKDLDEPAGDHGVPRRFTFKELAVATKNFSSSEKLGNSTVSRCYRATLGGVCLAAVKLLPSDPSPARISELAVVSSSHKNLIRLLGWCSSSQHEEQQQQQQPLCMLVYDFVTNGSLEQHLFTRETSGLPWSHRHKIACGVAAALECLHSKGVVHGNIKPSNVILDSSFTARLGDYGSGAAGGTRGVGTFGYIAPEAVQTGRCSSQADVFAFGAVILELACGRRALESVATGGVDVLVDRVWEVFKQGQALEEAVDPKLGGLYDAMEMEVMVRVGLACSNVDPAARPSMESIVKVLAGDVPPPMLEKEEKGHKRRAFDDDTSAAAAATAAMSMDDFNSFLAGVGTSSRTFEKLL